MLAAEGRLEEAYQVAAATNSMPEICGRICPQDRLCEGACVLEQADFGTVTIGAVEQFLTDNAWEQGWIQPAPPVTVLAQSVGIIGAGPAGLAAADMLRQRGFNVTVYDRYDRAGGLLMYGIPGFKLEKKIVSRRTDKLRKEGVEFILDTDIGSGTQFAEARSRHDAILIATGVYRPRTLACPGIGNHGVLPALEYLVAANKMDFPSGAMAISNMCAKNKRVVVLGGGDTAMDCVRTAVRQGATSVTCLYRRDRENMPGSRQEVINAEEEGVHFEWLASPKAILGEPDKTIGVRAIRMKLSEPDRSGRQTPIELTGTEFDVEAELVISALGFEPEDLPKLFDEKDLDVAPNGTISVDPQTMQTSLPGVFAAGDIVRGASLVVWAIRDGRQAAKAMTDWLISRAPEIAGKSV